MLIGYAVPAPDPPGLYGEASLEGFENPVTVGTGLPVLPVTVDGMGIVDVGREDWREDNPPVAENCAVPDVAALLVFVRPDWLAPPAALEDARDPLPPIPEFLLLPDKAFSSMQVAQRRVLNGIFLTWCPATRSRYRSREARQLIIGCAPSGPPEQSEKSLRLKLVEVGAPN